MSYINNELRDKLYENNVAHGFWENYRSFDEYQKNVEGEFEEAVEELRKGHLPTEVYYKPEKPEKPEGTPTELADVIIFVLDFFGGNNINVDEEFLSPPHTHNGNEPIKEDDPYFTLQSIAKEGREHLSMANFYYKTRGLDEFVGADGKPHGVSTELHEVINSVLFYCDLFHINMEKELIDKINYNNTRPYDYRKMGQGLLPTGEQAAHELEVQALSIGPGMLDCVDGILDERNIINQGIMEKRELRAKIVSERTELPTKK